MPQPNNLTPEDEQLVRAVKESDSGAFKTLFHRYYKPLIRFAWYRIYSMETASDLVQEVFIKIWMNRHRLIPEKSIKAYLYKSLTNAIINYTKLHSSKNISLDNLDSEKNAGNFYNPDTKLDLENAINELPEKLKTAYMLSRIEGYNYNEIAEICGISVKAVEKRMSNAFKFLRKKFIK